MKLRLSVAQAALVTVTLLSLCRTTLGIDWRRLEAGDTVVVAAEGAEFYVGQVVAARLKLGTTLKVIELLGSTERDPKVWVGASVMIDGKPNPGWVHSRKVYKPDNPDSIATLKKFTKVKVETDYLGAALRVDANDSDITGEALAKVKGLYNLEGLELSGTKITDDDLAHLSGLTNLQWLYLDNTKVTDKGLEHLQGLANLDVLALNKSQVTGPGLTNLKGLKKLRVLNLSECKISDAALESIHGLVQIQTLGLESLPITGEGLKHLAGLTRLNVVNLNHTKLASRSLMNLKDCKELRILYLAKAQFDPKDKEDLPKEIPSLAIFD
jgi:Leucine-rich repeat (LRR) protein